MADEFHPAADAFPMMNASHLAELTKSIQAEGQLLPIVMCDGLVLDGRNRWLACRKLGIRPKTQDFHGNPWAHAWSLNGQRRDLVAEQRYLIWRKCNENSEQWQAEQQHITDEANRKRAEATREQPRTPGGARLTEKQVTGQIDPPPDGHSKRQAAAVQAEVTPSTVKRADTLADNRPDLAKQVRQGTMKPAEAHRQMKRDAVAEKVAELPEGKYVVIYADPPWKYNDAQAVKGAFGTGTGAAEGHYPTMSLAELKALDIRALAADDAVLFLWATSPLLVEALNLLKAWGFKYKAAFIWDKIKHNMGHYNSVRHEFLLIGTRGSCTPQKVKLFDSVQSIERTTHSAKPERFREIIDTLYPAGPRIELFARGTAPASWKTWGADPHAHA